MKRALLAAAFAFLPATVSTVPRAIAKPAPKPAEGQGPGSHAGTDEILDAIAEEMNRATTQLEIPGAPKPYFIAYKITEVDVNDVAASYGNVTSRRNRH